MLSFPLVCPWLNPSFSQTDGCCPNTLSILLSPVCPGIEHLHAQKTCLTGPKDVFGQRQDVSGQHKTHLVQENGQSGKR